MSEQQVSFIKAYVPLIEDTSPRRQVRRIIVRLIQLDYQYHMQLAGDAYTSDMVRALGRRLRFFFPEVYWYFEQAAYCQDKGISLADWRQGAAPKSSYFNRPGAPVPGGGRT